VSRNKYDVNGKVALVTGGARGIGLETARSLARRGAQVVLVDIEGGAAKEAAANLPGGNGLGIEANVTNQDSMQQAVQQIVDTYGRLDIVVANAGIGLPAATFMATPADAFDRVVDVNLLGVTRTVRAALPHIVNCEGHIVVVSSAYAFVNGVGSAAYAMTKAAVEQFGRALRLELTPHGVTVTVAYFGIINTDLVKDTVDADPLTVDLFALIPKVLHKRMDPSRAGAAIARAIERRAPRLYLPARWTAVSILRGTVALLGDAALARDLEVKRLMRELDSRPWPGRGHEQEPPQNGKQ
jgi:NAD(P)-dependent dehydrogenase (short-subunit alcohol dehydrogenase family)